MQVLNNNLDKTQFGVRIVPNDAFRKTVKFAQKSGRLDELDNALHILSKVGEGDLLLINGVDKSGNMYSNFTINAKRTVANNYRRTPEESAIDGFIELAELGEKFKKLFGKNVKFKKLKATDVLNKYSDKSLG